MIAGLKIVREIKNNERFASYEARLDGRRVFAKKAASANTQVHLKFQAKNSQTVNQIGGKLFRAPEVIAVDSDWLVFEWVESSPLEEQIKTDPDQAAQVLAQVVAVFDSQPDAATPLRPIFTFGGLSERIKERIPQAIQDQSLTLFSDSLALFKAVQPTLQACLQDADVQPEHLFLDETKKAKYVLVDSEHLNTHWPRFYDLANNYTKYWKRNNRDFSAKLLKSYMEVYPSDELFESLVACIIVRCVALHWENDYDPGALQTNIPRSQELLKACLAAKNLSDLLY